MNKILSEQRAGYVMYYKKNGTKNAVRDLNNSSNILDFFRDNTPGKSRFRHSAT
jgi:16S rRNA U516 pseudouridylate synthase RsuA-like enzyme